MMKRIISFICAVVLIFSCSAFVGCKDDSTSQLLSFAQTASINELQKLDGKRVSIIGYMSTLSPVNGEFMYLMNLPYQSCPFCKPNSTQLSNTIAVYARDKDEFKFTDRAIQVTGTMDFGDFTDEFGYEYNYRIKDATYTLVDTSNMSEELKLWQQLASTDVIADVYSMFEYVNFLCYWPTYTANFESGKDYLYPSDALRFIESDGAQFNYGYKDGYFDTIIATIKSVDQTAFTELIQTVQDAKALAQKAYNELKSGKYTQTAEYSGQFNDGRTQYKINIASELEEEMNTAYHEFSTWLLKWEL